MNKKLTKKQIQKQLDEAISYLIELKEHESIDELKYFFEDIIGLTKEQIKDYDIY